MWWKRTPKPELHITLQQAGASPSGYPLTNVFVGGKQHTVNTYHKTWWPYQVDEYLRGLRRDYKLVITRI